VTADLGSDLSRNHEFFVIARNTAFTYKGRRVDLKQVGRELNVRHVLQGSVQRVGDRIRVQVEIDDVDTGAHVRIDIAPAPCFRKRRARSSLAPLRIRPNAALEVENVDQTRPPAERRGERLTRAPDVSPAGGPFP